MVEFPTLRISAQTSISHKTSLLPSSMILFTESTIMELSLSEAPELSSPKVAKTVSFHGHLVANTKEHLLLSTESTRRSSFTKKTNLSTMLKLEISSATVDTPVLSRSLMQTTPSSLTSTGLAAPTDTTPTKTPLLSLKVVSSCMVTSPISRAS